jgi:glycosyltransferase involved in cell wall biosynthesis
MSKTKPIVVVITRTKDRPIFLERAMKSVENQTYSDYLHVIVNDGGGKKEVEGVISRIDDPTKNKVKLFHRDVSSGAPDTIFNESIDRVDSEYFVIHDDDDTWDPDFLQKTVKHLDNHKQLGAVVVRTDKIIEAAQGDMIQEKKKTQWMPDVKVINLYRQCIDNQLTPIATLFRRSAYEDVGKFDSSLPVVGDWEFGVRLLQKYDVDYVDPGYALAYYHHRNDGANSFAEHDHRYYSNLVMNKYLREELADGRLGLGYIMSELKYNQSFIASTLKKILPTALVDRLKKRAGN